MLEALVSDLLNQYLGQFIENIDSKQLGTSVLSGSLKLTNMTLKPSLFDNSPLPFSLQFGRVGRIYIKIPFWDMFKSPLVVEIEDIFGFVTFKQWRDWDVGLQRKAFQEANQDLLAQYELFLKNKFVLEQSKRESSASFSEKLVARIMDNLRVSIKNVYFRFEDSYAISVNLGNGESRTEKEKFSIGMTLKEFSIFTTDKSYQSVQEKKRSGKRVKREKAVDDEEKLTFKTIKLEGFAVFCNWADVEARIDLQKLREQTLAKDTTYIQEILHDEAEDKFENKYFLHDLNIQLNLQLNNDLKNPLAPATLSFPQYKAELIVGSINAGSAPAHLSLFQPQVLRFLKIFERIGVFNEFRDGTVASFLEKKLSPQEKQQYLAAFIQYLNASNELEKETSKSKKDNKQIVEATRRKMKEIEDQVDHKQIIELRNQGHERVRNEDGRQSSLDKVEERIQAEMSEQIGFGLFLSASKKSKIEREVRQKYQPMIDAIKSKYDSEDDKISENIQNLLMDLKDDGDEDDEELLDFSLLPGDYVQLELTMLVPRLSFSLINEFNQELFTVGLLGFELHHKQANDRRASSLSLKEFNVQDQWIKSPTWPRLMDTVPVDAAQQSGEALAVLFDQDKDFKECPFKVKIAARKSCHMVLNIQLMNEVMRTMSIAMKNEKLDFNYFTEMALNQINQMRKRAKEYAENIQSGDYMHQNADIEADILAPVVILPQDIFDPYQRYIKADLGRITVGSQLQVYDKKKDYKREQEESALYDIYMLGLNKINLQVIEYVDHEQKHRKIMQDVTLGMTIRNCLEPLHPIYPTFKIDAKAETPISIEIVDVFDLAMRLLELKESLLVQLYSKDYNAIEKKKLADFNVQARMAKGVNDFQQIEEPGEDQEATKLIRQTRTKSRKLADDDDEAGGEEQYRQIVESRLRGDRRGAATNDSVNIQEQEKSSLAEEAGAPEGDGTNVQFRLHVPQMRIVLGTQDHNAYDERRKADIKLHETDRFIFEVRELSMLTNMDKQTSTITVEMGVQKLEIREEFGGVLDEEGDQQNRDKSEADEAMIKERAAGKDEFGQYGNLFQKMVFWNEKQVVEEPELRDVEQDPQDVRFDHHQMQARIELQTTQKDDPAYGLVVHQDVKVDLRLRQTILMANLETQRRVILALGRLVEVSQFDERNAKETYQLARNDMYSALQTINNDPNAAAENVKYRYIGTLFRNLAAMVDQAGPSQLPAFLDSIEKMLESDEDMQALQAFAKKAEMLQQENAENEQGQRLQRDLIKAASEALFKASENKRIVEYQQHAQQKVFFTMNISSIELWLCDFKKNHAEYSNIQQMAQVLQFKFGQDLEVNMKQFVKQLLVRKKRQEQDNEEDKVIFTETKYETVNKLVKQDDAIKFNLHQIQIAQKIFYSWESASELLLSDELLPSQTSNMLSPTDISIGVSIQSELNLDRAQHIKIALEPINLSQDYKDIQLLYTLLQRYQRTIQPSMAIFVDKIEEKINEVREKLKKNFKDAVEESLYQRRWTRMMSSNKDEQDEGSDEEIERIEDPIADRLDIRAHNENYISSIDFKRGSEVQTNMPQLFRKDSKAIEIKISEIQIKFCDGLLSNYQTQDPDQGIPLVLCRFEDLQLDVWQIDHDLSFDPLTGLRSHTITSQQHADFDIAEQKPPHLAVAMSLRMEATYFNQLTQYFEPFVEAWTVKQEITQKNKHSPFDVNLKSSDLLNVNVTYGMAASLRNIQNEVNEILRRVDEQMMVDDKLEKERGDKRQTLTLLQKESAQRRFTDQTQARFGAANYATQGSQRAAAPQEADPTLGDDPEPIHDNAASNRLLKYTIVNHTGLDISIMNATQKMAIQKNLGGGLTEEELANFQENQVIEIVCDEIEGGSKDALFQPQLQKAYVELDKLFQRNRDEAEIVQLEDDIDKINFKLIGEFQQHGAAGVHEFSKVQIEKNGIYGYESVVQDPTEALATIRSSRLSSGESARQPSGLEDQGFEHAMLPMDVIMSITSKGTQRTISFESQMVISNNTEFPITLCFTFQHLANLGGDPFATARQQDPARDPKSADVDQLDELPIDLAEFAEFKVPLKWYAMTNDKDRQTKINMYLIKKKEGSSFENDDGAEKCLVFEDITRRFRGKPKDVIKHDIKAKIVELHSDLYISVDVHGYACLPEHTKDKNPVQFLLQLNPPLVLYNKTMCALQVFEIDFPGTPQEQSKLQSKIPAGMSDSLFQLDVLDTGEEENKPDITLKFFDNDTEQHQGQRTVICKTLTSLQKYSDFDQDEGQINSGSKAQRPTNELTCCEDFERHRDVDLDQGKPADLDVDVVKFQIQCSKRSKNIQSQYSHHQGSVSADNLLRECIIEETKALQLSIYPKYMIVNKTSHDLWNGGQRIKAMHSDFLRLEEDESEAELFADGYKRSQPIDLNQIGMTGVITMDSDLQDSRQLQFGVNIQSAPSPFNMTIVLTVVPRYLIVNKLGKNVALRQYRKMKKVQGQEPPQDNTHAVHSFQSDANPLGGLLKTEFHFRKGKSRHAQPGTPDNLIQFRIVDDKLARDSEDQREEGPAWAENDDDSLWTLPFSVDQLDDFQTQLRDQEAELIGDAQQHEEQQNLLWTEPSRSNNHRRVVRVIITSNSQDDDATLLIILENPATEEFLIKNKTGITLQFHKYDKAKRRILDEVPVILEGYTSMPFVWDNRDINDKQVLILAPKKKATASLDQVSKYDQKKKEPKRNNLFRLAVRNSQDPQPRLIQLYSTLKVNQMSTKILTIHHKELDPEKRAAAQRTVRKLNAQDSDEGAEDGKQQTEKAQEGYLGIDQNHLTEYEDPESAKGAKGINFSMHLKGMGISMIDNQPKELLYATLSDLKVDFKMSTSVGRVRKKNNDRLIQTKMQLRLSIGNLQVDNMLDDEMSVLFCPTKLYKDLVLTERNYDEMGPLQREYRAIEPIDKVLKKRDGLVEQVPKKAQEDEERIPFVLVSVVKNTKSYQHKIGSVVRFDEIHCAMQEFSVQVNTGMIVNIVKFMIQTMYLFEQDQEMNYVSDLTNMQFEESSQKKLHEICPFMDSSQGVQIDEDQINVNKLSYGIIMLGSIKSTFNITLDKNKVEDLKLIYGSVGKSGVVYLLGPLLQSFASVSDLAIQFHELIILESFISQDMLIKNISNHYKYQIKSQLFRILGSSNLLGNPAGLLDKVGHGVFQMARDPIVGMSQGPTAFVKGVGTGMQGLVKGVIGGSFNSLGNITGSMYAVIKTTTGQEDNRSTQKATGVVSGVKQGVKGFGSELLSGVSGIVKRPAEGAKKGGFKGFVKGVGKGIVGAVATPVTGTLRAGESLSQGISGTATSFSNVGKSVIQLLDPKTVRVRESRRVDLKGRISCYNEDLAIVNFYMQRIKKGMMADQQIRYFETLPDPAADGSMRRGRANLLVLTTDYLLVMRPQNFSTGKQAAKLDQSVILLERLSNIYEYKVMMSPELHLEPKAGKSSEPLLIQAGFFLVVVAAVEAPAGGAGAHAQGMRPVDLASSSLADVQVDPLSPQDLQVAESELKYGLGDSFPSRGAASHRSTDRRLRNATGYSMHSNTAVQVIENQSLTTITSKLHKNFKIKEFYNEIADFGYLKVGKVNGQNLTRDSLLVQMFRSADIAHTSTTIASELGEAEEERPDQIQVQVQNPLQLYKKLHRLATHPKRRTVIYSDKYEVFDRVFQLLDVAVPEAKENAMVLNQLRKEIRYAQKNEARDGLRQ